MSARRDPKRGRHKRRRSPETLRWEREHLLPPCPPWMPERVYRAFAELRNAGEPTPERER